MVEKTCIFSFCPGEMPERPCPGPCLWRRRGGAGNGAVTMHYVYILQSEADKGYYYGSTSDLEKRVKEHNAGRVKSTKSRRPLNLHYYEEYDDKREALKREQYFKKRSGYRWLKKQAII